MSYAPTFGAPGGHTFAVGALGLKTHVFTAIFSQHASSEVRMRYWRQRVQTDRNTPNRLKFDFDYLNITDF